MAAGVASPDRPIPQNVTATEMRAGLRAAALTPAEAATGNLLTPIERGVMRVGAERVQAKKGLESLKPLATGFTRTEWRTTVSDQLLTDFDASGNRVARAGEDAAVALATQRMQASDDYMANGFDGMPDTPGGQTAVEKQDMLRAQMRGLLQANPTFVDAYGDAAGAIQNATIDKFLRQDGIRTQLAASLNDALDPAKIPAQAEANYRTAATTLRTRQGEQAALEVRRDSYANAAAERTTFDTDATYNAASIGRAGVTRIAAVTEIGTQLAGAPDLGGRSLQNDLNDLDVVNKQLARNSGNPGLINRKARVQQRIDQAKADPTFGAKCQEFVSLYTQSLDINTRINDAPAMVPALNGAIVTKVAEIAAAQADVNRFVAERQGKAGEFTAAIDNSITEATQKFLEDSVIDFIHTYRDLQGGKGAEAVTKKYGDALRRALDARWLETYQRRRLFRTEPDVRVNRQQVRADFATLATSGPDGLIEQMLIAAGVPVSERAVMMQDTAFMQSQRAELTAKALSAYVGTGGKLSEQHIRALATTSYGEQAIQGMISSEGSVKSLIDQAKASGLLKEGTVAEMHKKFGSRGLIGILMMILGIIGVGGLKQLGVME